MGGLVLRKKKEVGSPHPLSYGELVRVCRYLVCVELGGDDCDEVLEHLVIYSKKEEKLSADDVVTKPHVALLSRLTVKGDLLCPVQGTDDARHLLPER